MSDGDPITPTEQRFRDFFAANPAVYTELVALARQAKKLGQKRIGIRMLWEVVRWNRLISASDPNDPAGYKMNDHYHSRYARIIMEKEKDLIGFFALRELRS